MSIDLDDSTRFRRVMGKFATGVTVVSWMRDGAPAGMTANAFMSVSLEPRLVLVSARNASRFCASVARGDTFGINFLGEHQEALSMHFGGKAMEGLGEMALHGSGTPFLPESLAHLIVRVADIHPAGDHQLYVAEVLALEACDHHDSSPLLYYGGRYGRLASPQARHA
ncbi:flavin reductase family protein [Cupriavidus agavae]|uniref:Flavin reductase (DIM6/NTAB) family NADH-FMN oxidoreductase RutF n=1 Tax=Cupriavidus agavae TaxID=1001822 RepID=A0A4Q7RTD6_9BURK|nr:flavin reductase family protein [Cupriavidus agavae]RZT36854.1 flavin reductase (DIM6/NTAB) family NADH-FMN oxidoreductase RutF [Cupriavidus agavae]